MYMEGSVRGEEVLRYMSVLLGAHVKCFHQGRGGPNFLKSRYTAYERF